MAKKMVLVDPNQLLLKTSPVPDTLSDSVLKLDEDMKNILNRTDITEREKILTYQHALQQYLSKIDKVRSRTPVVTSTVEMNTPPGSVDNTDQKQDKIKKLESRLIEGLPKVLREKGRSLLGHMKDVSDMTWNERGEILQNGEPIVGSNIYDLLNEVIRSRKQSNEPKGWDVFSKALKSSNVPMELIGNKTRWNTEKTTPPLKQRLSRQELFDISKPNPKRIKRSKSHGQQKNTINWLPYGRS